MGQTNLSIKGRDFYINGKPVYDEIKDHSSSKGLLMNARFIMIVSENSFFKNVENIVSGG